MEFINSYARLPAHFFADIDTAKPPNPRLIAWNDALAQHLGLSAIADDREQLARWFSGAEPLPGGRTIALAYAGHQFGNFVPQLGDGRAALLGELRSPVDGLGYDIQLKGSGPTPFSRRGDGKASLGPVIREYLLSEAMHRLGVPTTRALAAVATGEVVFRDGMEPGGVITRVASSHIRVGTFEYFLARRDVDALRTLTDYAIERHYPEVVGADHPVSAFFAQVVQGQARLIAHWMALGFIHGVMNTDNCAISGETIDYGPCAFMDEFDINKVFSSIDRQGRYAYGQQSNIAIWNLYRLAEALMQLEPRPAAFEEILQGFQSTFEDQYFALMAPKLGLSELREDDPELMTAWLQYLQDHGLDYSLSFIRLRDRIKADEDSGFGEFADRWLRRIAEQEGGAEGASTRMALSNPLYIPRNHQVERAIQAAFMDDFSVFEELHRVLSEPYTEQPGMEHYALPPGDDERVEMTFCGT
ncbi:MAG: protein adenylyltransferase SelO [Gammaproteobacteria bacterium]